MPVATVLLALVAIWYPAALWMNHDLAAGLAEDGASAWTVALASLSLDRPVLPAPHQVVVAVLAGVFGADILSPRSLVYHAGITASAGICGFALALLLGVPLAAGVVHARTLDRAIMPWVIASQTIPVLAIAPMVVVVLGAAGQTGLVPKALIAGWLSFFPVTIAMVTGLRSADPMQRDLMRTYGASGRQMFWSLRWPSAIPFLFPALKVTAALALVGAIVAELPTGAAAGLGARLLAGSYYGQTLQIWAALVMAGMLALVAMGGVALARAAVVRGRGGRL